MPSFVPFIADISTILDNISPNPNTIDPITLSRMGSIMDNWEENNYNIEWEFRDNFIRWLTYEQATIGIEIELSRMHHSKNNLLYLACKTYCCTCNKTGGKKDYMKKTMCERKINSKWIESGCSYSIQIKIYPYTNTKINIIQFLHIYVNNV